MYYSYEIKVSVPREKIFPVIQDLDKCFRLNPQWAVLSAEGCKCAKNSNFVLKVRYDRTDMEMSYTVTVEEYIEDSMVTLRLHSENPRLISIKLADSGVNSTTVCYIEAIEEELSSEEKVEINFWLKSIINYIIISEKKTLRSRLWKWFIDRLWLKMSPAGRRIALMTVAAEALALIFFILLIIGLLIFK